MGEKKGWWKLNTNVWALDDTEEAEIDEVDLEHIAEMIRQGYTSGEIC